MNLKLIIFGVFLICLTNAVSAQSIFKTLPPYRLVYKANRYSRSLSINDSLPSISTGKWQGFRLAGPDVMFALPDLTAWTGAGIDYVFATADVYTGKWNYNETIGVRINGGANLGSASTIRTVGGFSLRASFFNGLLALGAIYNLTTKKPQAGVGNPVAFIPGLN